MKTQRIALTVGSAIIGIGLTATATACSSDAASTDYASSAPSTTSSSAAAPVSSAAPVSPAAAAAPIKVIDAADLGTILVDVDGRAVYALESDTATTSACTGKCAQNWPIVIAPQPLPASITGFTGTLGALTLADGRRQLTVNDHPLYTFSGDQTAGQYNGRGKQFADGRWGVVEATGNPAY